MKPRAEATDGAAYDVVVVGAGGAGMTAALAAARQGLDTVLVEKSQWFGGSTARSGGGVWIPGNYALVEAGEADDPVGVQALPRLHRRRRRAQGAPRHPHRPRPRGDGLHPRADPGAVQVGAAVLRLPARAAGRTIPWAQRRAGPDGRALPRRRAGAPAPAVHQGAGEPDRHPGRLPQDQPGHAHPQGPVDDAPGDAQPAGQHPPRPQDVRDGQRPRHRPASGAHRRGRPGRVRRRADRVCWSRTVA